MTTKITVNIENLTGVTIANGCNLECCNGGVGSTILNETAGNGYFLDTNTGVIEVILPKVHYKR